MITDIIYFFTLEAFILFLLFQKVIDLEPGVAYQHLIITLNYPAVLFFLR